MSTPPMNPSAAAVPSHMPSLSLPSLEQVEVNPLSQLAGLVQLQMQQQNQQAQQIQQLFELVQRQIHTTPSTRSTSPPPTVKPTKPSTFSGGRGNNARTWLSEMERYLAFMKVPPHEVVPFVVTHLRDAASVWYDNLCQQEAHREDIKHWQTFKQLFLDNFQPVEASKTARSVLYRLKQRGAVVDYCDSFRSYLNQINRMEVEDQIFLFLNGLNPSIAREVSMHQPKTLAQAMSIAQRADIENRQYNTQPRRWWNAAPPTAVRSFGSYNSNNNGSAANPVPMELGNIQYNDSEQMEQEEWNQTNEHGTDQLNNIQRSQGLSREQLEYRKRNGLCFACGLPGHSARNCSSRRSGGVPGNRNTNPAQQQSKNVSRQQ
jgi:hypothetical protein